MNPECIEFVVTCIRVKPDNTEVDVGSIEMDATWIDFVAACSEFNPIETESKVRYILADASNFTR